MIYKFFTPLLVLILISCSNETLNTPENKDSLICILPPPDTTLNAPSDMKMFMNVEQVEFCVPLPLEEYFLDEVTQRTRGQFLFYNKKDSALQIELKGLFRSDPSVTLEEYFNTTYSSEETEGQGIIITEKSIVAANNCFYAKGYMSNLYDKQRFIEITWLRNDDVVKLNASFAVSDTAKWDSRLQYLIGFNSLCEVD